MNNSFDDVIIGISTALAEGAISIIRLSGKGCIEIANKSFKGKNLTKVNSHTVNYGFIVDNNSFVGTVGILDSQCTDPCSAVCNGLGK